jgi:hypothetical protein
MADDVRNTTGREHERKAVVAWLAGLEAQLRARILATKQQWFKDRYEPAADALKHARETIERGEHE